MYIFINKKYKLRAGIFILGIACVLLSVNGWAQSLREIEPKPVPKQVEAPTGNGGPTIPETAASGDKTVMLESLKGVIAIASKEQLATRPAIPVGGVHVGCVDRIDNETARNILKAFVGKPVSMASLNMMVTKLQQYYVNQGFPFVSIGFPEQDVSSGVVQVLIVESVLGNISIEGNRYFSDKHYLSLMHLHPGNPISQAVMKKDSDWINDTNPFRAGDFFLRAGKNKTGTTDLDFRVNERLPLRLTLGYNNNGTKTTGEDRLEAGINWGNAFGLGHQVSYQFTTNKEFSDYTGHSISYIAPLPWQHTFSAVASKSKTRSRLDDDLMKQEGESSQLSLAYKIPLKDIGSYRHSLSPLFDYKENDNNLDFSNIPVIDNNTNIFQWGLSYEGSLPDSLGVTSFSVRGIYSPGSINSMNDDLSFDISRAKAKAEYAYATFHLDRTHYLPEGFSLALRNRAQIANGNLLGSEQMQFGGYSSIRGYKEGDTYTDQGFILTQELHGPAMHPGSWCGIKRARDQIDVYIFHDYGFAQNGDLLQGEDSHTYLQSVGVGANYFVGRHFSLNCSYGWQLRDTGASDHNSHGHISAIFSF
jgi:hemolysin activation/secretion protein